MEESEIREKISHGFIRARMIVEVIGKPKEKIEQVLDKVIEEFKKAQKIETISIHKEKAEETEKYFHTFCELEFLAENVYALVGVCLDLTPSSIEILEPSNLKFTANDLTDFLNDFTKKLHEISLSSKNSAAEINLLNKSFHTILFNMINLLINKQPRDIEFLSKYTGVKVESLEKIMQIYIKQGKIKLVDNKYSLNIN